MRQVLLTGLLGLAVLQVCAQLSAPIIRASGLQWVTTLPDGADCDHPNYVPYQTWADTVYDHRAILSHTGDPISFWTSTFTSPIWELEWHIDRLTGPELPDHSVLHGETVDTTLVKFSTGSNTLWEKYLVTLYRTNPITGESELTDWTHVHVLNGATGEEETMHYTFDQTMASATAPLDNLGRVKVTSGPVFSGNGNRRSELNVPSEKMLNMCIYPAYGLSNDLSKPGASSRDGDGYLRVFNPPVGSVTGLEAPYEHVCDPYNPFTYDFCSDPCVAYADAVSYDSYVAHDKSICSNVELNTYPSHQVGEDFFYAFSFRIPSSFIELDMIGPEGELGHARRHVVAEFMQPKWPLDPALAGYPCSPTMQLIYLGNGKMGLQYGVKGWNRAAFGPWDCPKGAWIDVAMHVKWEDIRLNEAVSDSPEGLFEIWLNHGEGYQKQCLKPATEFYLEKRELGEGEDVLQPFTTNVDETVLYGPNLINPNPAYLSLKSKRAVGYNGACGLDFISAVDFDELRIGTSLEEVVIPNSQILTASATCGDPVEAVTQKTEIATNTRAFSVYPNPASQVVHLDFDSEQLPDQVVLLDGQGRTVHQVNPDPYGSPKLVFQVDHLPTGTYHLQALYGSEVSFSTLIIQ